MTEEATNPTGGTPDGSTAMPADAGGSGGTDTAAGPVSIPTLIGVSDGSPQGAPEQTETMDDVADPELYLGKFENPEAMAKSYSELEKKLHEQGKLAPDEYDMSPLELAGLTVEGFEEDWAAQMPVLQKHAISQEAFADLAMIAGQIAENTRQQVQDHYEKQYADQMAHFGIDTDRDAEMAKLQEVYGNRTDAVMKSIEQWAASGNIHKNVLTRPLGTTAEGVQFLHSLMDSQRGPSPMRHDDGDSFSPDDLEAQITALTGSDDYLKNPVKQRQADKLSKVLAELEAKRR